MIGIELNEENFEYDIYSLVKAFYPEEEITRVTEGEGWEGFLVKVNYQLGLVVVEVTSDSKARLTETIEIKGMDRKEVKSMLKRALYSILSGLTKKTLPWGTLTGIRPTKIPFSMLLEGKTEEEIASYMQETYLAGKEKTALSIEIAKREQEILRNIDYKEGYSLYIGIPFCPTRCLYCSFTSYPLKVWEKRVDS